MKKDNILVLGGAGLIGSNISEYFLARGHSVAIIDSLEKNSSASLQNISSIFNEILFYKENILNLNNLEEIIELYPVIIDCIGFTSHHEGLENPELDLAHNLLPQIHLISKIRTSGKKIIYLGSRTQYGKNLHPEPINETSVCLPLDPQGINKLAAEHYYRIYSEIKKFQCVSLRVVNVFGPRQKIRGTDIGLIGSFIKNALAGADLNVFDESVRRQFICAADLAKVVYKVYEKLSMLNAFEIFNVVGPQLKIIDMANFIIENLGSGTVQIAKKDDHKRQVDVGNTQLDGSKLQSVIGEIEYSNFSEILSSTLNYFQNEHP